MQTLRWIPCVIAVLLREAPDAAAIHLEDADCYMKAVHRGASFINCQHAQLSGTIPEALGNHHELVDIRLNGNQLTGTIPSLAFGKLTSLTDFRLDGNRLAGTIPPSLGDLGALTALGLSRNRLSGTIPFALKRLTHLSFLDVSYNDLEGCVPRVGPCKEGIDSDHDGHCYVTEHPGSAGERTHGNEMITGPCGGGGQRGAAAKPGYGREL